MRNVGRKYTPSLKTTLFSIAVIAQSFIPFNAMGDVHIFQTFVPRASGGGTSPSDVSPPPPSSPAPATQAPTLPQNVSIPLNMAIGGGTLNGRVPFQDLASVPTIVATAADHIQGLNLNGPGMGGLAMESPQAARDAIQIAKIALGTAELLLKNANKNTSQNESAPNATYAVRLPLGAWPQRSFFDSGETGYEDANASSQWGSFETLLASNGKVRQIADRDAQWKDLDQLSLEYTYALQFVGYGILHDDGPVFVTWAIAHAVRMSNNLNNQVINELEVISTYPKSKLRDDKIHALLAYVKNPNLKRINGWLGSLRDGLLQQEVAQAK